MAQARLLALERDLVGDNYCCGVSLYSNYGFFHYVRDSNDHGCSLRDFPLCCLVVEARLLLQLESGKETESQEKLMYSSGLPW